MRSSRRNQGLLPEEEQENVTSCQDGSDDSKEVVDAAAPAPDQVEHGSTVSRDINMSETDGSDTDSVIEDGGGSATAHSRL